MICNLAGPDFAQNERDIDQILALNLAQYGPTSPTPSTDVVSTRADFFWRRDQNPAGQGIVPVIRNEQGDVIGFMWLIPLKIRVKNQNYRAATGANLLIQPESRGTFGLVKLLRKFNQALLDDQAVLHYSFVSAEAYKRCRVDDPRRAFTVPLLVKPLDFAGLAQSYFSEEWLRSIARIGGWAFSPLLFRKAVSSSDDEINVDITEHFDDSFDEFWRRVQDKHRAAVIRDCAFLEWRFVPISGRRYHILVARSKREMLGYAVIRCAKVRGIETGLILDLLVVDGPRGIEAGLALVARAEVFFRTQKMWLIASLMAPGSAEYRVLTRSGCRNLAPVVQPRPFRFAFFLQNSNRQDLESISAKDWFITFADFESL